MVTAITAEVAEFAEDLTENSGVVAEALIEKSGVVMEEQLTREIIGAAIEVHRALGPGLLESAYQACLAQELVTRGMRSSARSRFE